MKPTGKKTDTINGIEIEYIPPFESKMIEIKVGQKLDLAIATAVGLKTVVSQGDLTLMSFREWDEIRGTEHVTCEGALACIPFQPSTDLNAAFVAAKIVELFSGSVWRLLGMDEPKGKTWGIFESELPVTSDQHKTPALAICATILKLAEKEETK